MSTARDMLAAARKRIAAPGCWTQHAFAKDPTGLVVCSTDARATSYCMLGALLAGCNPKVFETWTAEAESCLVTEIRKTSSYGSISGYNDAKARTHADVLNTYDAAINACST